MTLPMRIIVAGAKTVFNAGEGNSLVGEILSAGLVEELIGIVENWPQVILDVVNRDLVVIDSLADAVCEPVFAFNQQRHRGVKRSASLGVGRNLAEMLRHPR